MNHRATLLAAVAALMLPAASARADATPPPLGSFTIAVLPDTQVYAQSYPHIFNAQTQWIKDHRDSHNIQYVLQLGDITNNNTSPEWNNAKAAMSILEGYVPYAIALGNHDYGSGGGASNRSTLFNLDAYFGPRSAYAAQPTIGGFYEAGRTDNSYHTFRAGGRDWLVLATEFGPRNGVADWIDQVLSDHPDHTAIYINHAHVYSDDTRYDWELRGASQLWNPHSYPTAADPDGTNDGQELWDKVFSKHDNLALAISGHVLYDGTGRLISVGDQGQVVHEMLANYQMITSGGNGYMRLLEIQPDGKTINVRTYSPYVDAYNTQSDQQFTIGLVDDPIPMVHSRAVLDDDPILYYRLEATQVGEAVENLGAVGVDLAGTYSGPGPTASAFDGSGGQVQTAAAVPDMSRWSIAAWARPDTSNSRQTVLSNDRPGFNDDVLFGLAPNGSGNPGTPGHWGLLHQDDDTGVQTLVEGHDVAVATRWYHLVATSDGDVLRLYVDGELVGEAPRRGGDLDFGGYLVRAGAGFDGDAITHPFGGTIGEVALFDRALSISDVTEQRLAALNRVVAANLIISGPTDPNNSTIGAISIPKDTFPGVSALQADEGDVAIGVGGSGVSLRDGVLLGSVAQNIRDGLSATVEVGRSNFASVGTNGGLSLSMAEAGLSGAGVNEVNVNASVAWFPFSGGWTGAHVNRDGTFVAARGVDESMLRPHPTERGRYTLNLGVDSRSDGMLFTIGSGSGDNIVPTGVLADGSGWDIRVQNNAADFSDGGEAGPFSFLYLPYDTPSLIGGRYDGLDERNLESLGDFTMTAIGRGEYLLSIDGESPETGMLLLNISGLATSGGRTAPDDNFLTYEARQQDFLIQSRDLPFLRPRDTEFVWAFVSFSGGFEGALVPEPSGVTMVIGCALGVLAFWRRRCSA